MYRTDIFSLSFSSLVSAATPPKRLRVPVHPGRLTDAEDVPGRLLAQEQPNRGRVVLANGGLVLQALLGLLELLRDGAPAAVLWRSLVGTKGIQTGGQNLL